MMAMLSNNGIEQKTPLIVELVGPAGAGKTMVSRALSQRDGKIQIGAYLQLRRMGHIPFFVSNALSLMPVFLRRCRGCRWFNWQEIKALAYLRGWHHVLRQPALNNCSVIILDHGPVFWLAWLREFGPESLKCRATENWWNIIFKQWAFTLDMVIWLDAPDLVLVKRINRRSQQHFVKGKSELEAYHFLNDYRTSLEEVMSELISINSMIRVLHFDSSRENPGQIVEELVTPFNLG